MAHDRKSTLGLQRQVRCTGPSLIVPRPTKREWTLKFTRLCGRAEPISVLRHGTTSLPTETTFVNERGSGAPRQ